MLLPFFIYALLHNQVDIAILLIAAIALSDALDGISARIMDQQTKIGELMDSTTDWLVILSTIITLFIIKKYLPIKVVIALLVPLVIILIAKSIYIKKKKNATPTIIGKITVSFAYITIIVILIDFAYKEIFLIIAIVLTYITMLTHLIKYINIYIK